MAPTTFLGRLRRDTSGNTIAIMAAALVPMLGFAGSAVDFARIYVVKVRLQQACDAGALAGRKAMNDTSSSTPLETAAVSQADAFFYDNFPTDNTHTGWYQTTNSLDQSGNPLDKFTPSKLADPTNPSVANTVQGVAQVRLPMSVMSFFGIAYRDLYTTCQARLDLADTDVVFVLDTTGSMACLPSDTDATCDTYVNGVLQNNKMGQFARPADSPLGASSGSTGSANDSVAGYPGSTGYYVPDEQSGASRIAALRQAVIQFYNTVATVTASNPNEHVRYGFVTYTSTVNAGKAVQEISPSYMVGGAGNGTTTWTYDTRYIDPTNANSQYQASSSSTTDSTPQASCTGSTRTPAATGSQPYTFNTSSQATVVTKAWVSNKCQVTTTVYGPNWTYGPRALDVSGFLTNASVIDPSKLDGSTASWLGCIEERDTTAGTSSFNNASLPPDLDPDLIPSSDSTRWRPMWPEAIYWRNYLLNANPQSWYGSTSTTMDSAYDAGDTNKAAFYATQSNSYNFPNAFSYFYYNSSSLLKSGVAPCGKPVRRISSMTLQDVTNYVNAADFSPLGGTYHDIGMIWGTRMLSTKGIFANDTTPWPGHQATNKVIVFLTDGSMEPALNSYSAYGLEYFDKRVTGGDYNPTNSGPPNTQQTAYHNARFLAECTKAKSMNINIWTVMITTAQTATTPLQQCATNPSQSLVSSSGSDLQSKFVNIAKQVAMLRITQ